MKVFSRPIFLLILISSFVPWTRTIQAQSEPVVQYVAPEKCLFYSGWNPTIAADPDSPNRTQQWLSDERVSTFLDDMAQRIPVMFLAANSGNQESAELEKLAQIAKALGKSLFRKSGCVFIESLEIDRKNGSPSIEGALMVEQGANVRVNLKTIVQLLDATPAKTQGFFEVQNGDVKLTVGAIGKFLVLAIGENSIESMMKRGRRKTVPSWLQKTLGRGKEFRYQNNFMYLDVEAAKRIANRAAGAGAGMVTGIIGLNDVKTIEWISGLNETESVSKLLIRSDAAPEGILGLLNTATLTPEQVAFASKDALFSMTVAVDPASVYKFLLSIEPLVMGRPGELKREMSQFKKQFGFDLMDDIWNQLGPTWTLYNNREDGLIGGLVLTTEVKDANKINLGLKKFIEMVILESRDNRSQVIEKQVGEHKIYSLQIPREFVCYPSICVTGDRAYLSLFPQAIETALTQKTNQPLIDSSMWQKIKQNSGDKVTGVFVADEKQIIQTGYPMLQMMQALNHEFVGWRQLNLQALFNAIDAPPARSMYRVADKAVAVLKITEDGIELNQTQTFPDPQPAIMTVLPTLGLSTAIDMEPGGLKLAESQNKIRQIALAVLNFESAFRRFPSDTPTLNAEAKDLKPRLSWRVHLLPFVEQNNLYEQFKLEEPWDSPHNKKLIAKMPKIFRSPASRAAPGMTTYRGIGGANGVFASKRRGQVGFRSIRDGASNTILALECPDEMAVPWTKPGTDLDHDTLEFIKLLPTYRSGVNTVFCDGSSRLIPSNCTQRDFSSMMQMNDGNIVAAFERPTMRMIRQINNFKLNPAFQLPGTKRVLTVENFFSDAAKSEFRDVQKLEELGRVGIALHNFHNAYRGFPVAYDKDNSGKPLLSWRVHILPFMGEQQLHSQFRLNEPWDSPHNKQLVAKIPEVFKMFGDGSGKTGVMGVGGPKGIISEPLRNGRGNRGIRMSSVTDGTANTAMLVTVGKDGWTEWTRPTEFVPNQKWIDWFSSNSFILITADAAKRRIKPGQLSKETIKNVMERNDGNVVQIPGGEWPRRARTRSSAMMMEEAIPADRPMIEEQRYVPSSDKIAPRRRNGAQKERREKKQ